MEALTARINEAEDRISDIEHQARKIRKVSKKETNNYWTTRRVFER